MSLVARPYWFAMILLLAPLARAQSHHGHVMTVAHGGGGHGYNGSMHSTPAGYLAGGFSGYTGYRHHSGIALNYGLGGYGYGFGYGYGLGYNASYAYSYPLLVNNGGGVPLLWPVIGPQSFGGGFGGGGGGGLMLPMPPQQAVAANQVAAVTPATRHRNLTRSKELVEIGDRSFRAGNIKRAEEKYHLAAKAEPNAPSPHVHLAQVSLARGDYLAAADHLRDAVTVANDTAWILNAPDIQAVFAEPADFAAHLARLETHLQANPNDRDAWFVLGAECYLSGRSKQASDVFQRLTDRKPDEALGAFLDASKTKLPPPAN